MNLVAYDGGMLLALVDQNPRAPAPHKGFVAAGGHQPIVPGPALSQAWRTSPKTAYAWRWRRERTPAATATRPSRSPVGYGRFPFASTTARWRTAVVPSTWPASILSIAFVATLRTPMSSRVFLSKISSSRTPGLYES
ncbi:hypothetical protein SATRM34S_04588 [Streptomyces atroolivaceus]